MQVEIDLAGHPVLVALGEPCRNEAQAGRGVGEDRGDAGAALDLAVEAFEAVGDAPPGALRVRQAEDDEALGKVLPGPRRSASAWSGALKIARMRRATGWR